MVTLPRPITKLNEESEKFYSQSKRGVNTVALVYFKQNFGTCRRTAYIPVG